MKFSTKLQTSRAFFLTKEKNNTLGNQYKEKEKFDFNLIDMIFKRTKNFVLFYIQLRTKGFDKIDTGGKIICKKYFGKHKDKSI